MDVQEDKQVEQAPQRNRFAQRRVGLILLLSAFLVLAVAYSAINPLHEATDELRHYRFVRYLVENRRLPVQGQEPCRSQSHHPPLFYVLGAAATAWIETGRGICDVPEENPFWAYRYWEVGRDNKTQYLHGPDEAFPWSGEALAVHIVRLFNVLLGATVVWLTWATARVIWPDKEARAWLAAGLVGFNPMFLYMSGAINNDIIAALSGTAVVYACARLLTHSGDLTWRWGMALGALYGLALMSKFNLAAVIIIIEGALSYATWRRKTWREWLTINLVMLAVAAAVSGWWFVRNWQLYGEPTGFEAVTELWGVRDPAQSIGLAISELPYAWSTLWGRFGFGQIPLPEGIYSGLLVLVGLGLAGSVYGFLFRSREQNRVVVALLVADVLVFFLVLFNYMLVSPAGPNGRFFFPALGALALLVAYGLTVISAAAARAIRDGKSVSSVYGLQIERITSIVVIVAFAALAVVALFGYLAPAYARPPAIEQGADIPNAAEDHFDSLATLIGYNVSVGPVRPGESVDIELFWQVDNRFPGNFLLFVHLIDQAGTIAAQRDTHPGLGNFPTSQWQPGERFVDRIRVHIPETAYAPERLAITLGLYASGPEGYRLAVRDGNGRPVGDSVTVGTVELLPNNGSSPNAQQQNFENQIRLVGYELSDRVVNAGESVDLTLYWEKLADEAPAHEVLVSLVDETGQPVALPEQPLSSALIAGSGQEAGQQITSHFQLLLSKDTEAGTYAPEIVVRNTASGNRLNIVADDGHWIADYLRLAKVRVEP